MTVVAIVFWLSVGLILYAHAGYPVLLGLLACGAWLAPGARRRARPAPDDELPAVSVIVAAYAEQDVIADRVANIRALDYPAELIELIVACDGSPDATAARARAAGADLVLELPRGGKIRAQDAAVERAGGEIVAFSDANVTWEPDALRRLVAPFADPRVGYVCGEVQLVDARGSNQEGLYWRYELALRALESRVRSVTGGNGAIYATRREAYLVVDPIMGHDLSFPFNMVKRGWLALAVREAQASEKMVPTIEGEFARKRRMMSHTWPIVLRGGMLSPRGYDPLYALMIVSHRILRYLTPFLHVIALVANIAAARRRGGCTSLALALQVAVLVAAALAGVVRARADADRPLLRAHHRLAGRRAVGLARARHLGGLGAGGGDAMSVRSGCSIWSSRRRRRARDRAARRPAGAGDPARVARATRSTPRPASARTASCSRSTSCARWSAAPSSPAPAWRSRRATSGSRGSATFLRRYSLDELPNLWNVLRGEMSIVGPRPTLAVQVEQYTERQRGRLAVKPGITGWAQVNGRASLPWPERIELDLWYVEHRSLRARSGDPRPHRADGAGGEGIYKGERGGWTPTDRTARHSASSSPASASATTSCRPSPSTPPWWPPTPIRWRRPSTRPTTATPCRASRTPSTCRRCGRCARVTASARSCR